MAKKNTGKRGYVYCPKCTRPFKNAKALVKHSCDIKAKKEDNMEPCHICGAKKEKRNLIPHLKACQFRHFKFTLWPIFNFFFRIVSAFNLGIRSINYLGCKREKEFLLKRQLRKIRARTTLGYTPSANARRTFFRRMLAKRYYKATEEARNAFPDAPETLINFITEVEKELKPSISARQIMYDYLKERDVYNEKIYNYVDRKLKLKDYPTDNEIDVGDGDVATKVAVLRDAYDYNEDYQKLKSDLEGYINNNEEIRCRYCKKIIKLQKKHYRVCKTAQEEFYKDKIGFMKDYIQKFYNPLKLKEEEENDAIYLFLDLNYETFLSKIGNYFISHKKTIEKIEENKKNNLKINNKNIKKHTNKDIFNEILNEINDNNKKKVVVFNPYLKKDEGNIDENAEVETQTASILIKKSKKDQILVPGTPEKNTIEIKEKNNINDIKIEGKGLNFLQGNVKNPLNKKKHIKIKFINH